MISPEQRTRRARIAALSMHAAGKTNTGPAREAFLAKFLDEVDPDRLLPEAERQRRAALARKAYFQRLTYQRAARNGGGGL